ncbi:MAG: type II secretion system protein [Phycisphaeraceae bacterium]|nr:type II secretion system protein [Phycisphaeraceae bacterium]
MPQSTRTRGFTLLELITALTISAALVGAMAVLIATSASAMERGVDGSAHDREAGRALADLEIDLSEATKFFEQTATSIWFEVPDRNDDGVPEHIRYSWSGAAGDPLLRSTNGGTPAVVAADVRAFGLALSERPGLKRTESPEQLLASFTAHAGATSTAFSAGFTSWCAQVIRPNFAADVVSWKVTRVRFRAKRIPPHDGAYMVALVPLDNSRNPTTTVLASVNVNESTLGSGFAWVTVSFPTCAAIDPGQPVALRISGVSGTDGQCDVETLVSATPTMPFNTWAVGTVNSGTTWTAYPQTRNLIHEVYGTVVVESR